MATIKLNGQTFTLAPNIGHCITLKSEHNIDLLGEDGDADIAKLIGSPAAFCSILAVLIGSADDEYQMPALAGHLGAAEWTAARVAVLASFTDFFHAAGYPHLAAAIERLNDGAEHITAKVAESLEGGELRKKIDEALEEVEAGLLTVGN